MGSTSFVSANTSQGSCNFASGIVACSLGTLASGATSIVSIVTTPNLAGNLLTNTVKVSRNETESNLANNVASTVVYVPPVLAVGTNKAYYETNVGLWQGTVNITLSPATPLAVSFTASSIDGTAANGSDYVLLNQRFVISPGVSNATIPVTWYGDTAIENNETFFIKISNPTNATLGSNQVTVTLVNDDGQSNNVHYLAWNTITSPQRTNQPFSVTITARDASNNVATTFSTNVLLWGINIGGASSRTAFSNEVHAYSDNLDLFTMGYEFTPSTNIFITHFRHYFGTKVSLWNNGGSLLASTNVAGVPGEWTETELIMPVRLSGGSRYRIGAYSGGDPYYWRNDGVPTFGHGTLNQGYYANNDAFPTLSDPAKWTMVDFSYSLPGAIAPTNSANFVSGVWTGNINIQELGTNFTFLANDRDGHIGFANRFGVYQTNDLALAVTNSPATVLVGSNLSFSVRVLNSGPPSSTGVYLTNTLPSGVTNVSFVTSQGTCALSNGILICNLGTIGDLASATVTVSMTPLVAGLPLTNTAMIVRNESDPNSADNEAISIVTASAVLSALLRTGADYSDSAWRSSGNALWLMQTNTTYDGVDALQSGAITHSEESWVETTVRGPGILSFRWKVSSQAGGDNLRFIANGFFQTNITGEVNWALRSYSIPSGPWNLRWQYLKDGSISSGSDAGWLDQVTYTVPPFFFSALSATNTTTNTEFRATLNGTNGQRLFLQASSDLIQWSTFGTITLGGSTTNLLITTSSNFTYRFYRAQHRNN